MIVRLAEWFSYRRVLAAIMRKYRPLMAGKVLTLGRTPGGVPNHFIDLAIVQEWQALQTRRLVYQAQMYGVPVPSPIDEKS